METKTEKNKSELDKELSAKLQKVTIDESADRVLENVENQNCNNTKKLSSENSHRTDDTSIKLSNGTSSSNEHNHEESQQDKPDEEQKEISTSDEIITKCTLNPLERETIQISRDNELFNITYKVYESELELPSIMKLIQKDLSEVRDN